MTIRHAVKGLGFAAAAVLATACGKGTEVSVKVGSLPSALASRGRGVPTDAPASSTHWSYAKVDGVKLTLTKLQGIQEGNERDAISWSGGKEIIVAPGADNTIAITETASLPTGTYRGAKIRYNNSYAVKAYCRTSSDFVYTSAAGIQKVPIASIPATMPTDYDYYSYKFAEVTTATTVTGTNQETQASTDVAFTIASGSSLAMQVLVDPSYLVTCFDGTGPADGTGALSPFVWSNNNGLAKTDFFPTNAANFGMGYVPIFINVTTNLSEAIPLAETYASAAATGTLDAPINFVNVNVTTMVFKADGSILDGRTRIGSGSGLLFQFQSGFTQSGTNFTFFNGEWTCDAGYTNCRSIQDKKITGFQRISDYTTKVTGTLEDGPDCGKTITDPARPEWGNRARACAATVNYYWKKVTR